MSTPQLDALMAWFDDHEDINITQANLGIPDPKGGPPIKIARVAPLIKELRDMGWSIRTGTDGVTTIYTLISRSSIKPPGLRREPKVTKVRLTVSDIDSRWECSHPGCLAGIVPDIVTTFDGRYSTGRCLTHGRTVIVKRR